jgi:hypothetical protein
VQPLVLGEARRSLTGAGRCRLWHLLRVALRLAAASQRAFDGARMDGEAELGVHLVG